MPPAFLCSMDEVWLRVILIAGGFVLAGVVTVASRRRRRTAPRELETTGLKAGVYLMTSETCPDCGPVRSLLDETLGPDGYVEMSWEREPDLFQHLDVDVVPATLVVGDDGSGTMWPGPPDRALAHL